MRLIALLLSVALAGCATTGGEAPPVATDTCDRDAGQRFVGRTATADLAAEMLRATGATRVRWVPPRTGVTMDYAYGRLTVGYDDAMRVTSVSCG